MRTTVRSFALALSVVILSSSLTAFAAEPPRKNGIRDERPTPVVLFMRAVKRLFGISTNEVPSGPPPAPSAPTANP